MGRKGDHRPREFVDNLVAIAAPEMVRALGVDEPTAIRVATEIAHRMCFHYGRTTMYVPIHSRELELSARDERIWDKYHQDSATARRCTYQRLREVAGEEGLTERHLYRIAAMIRTRDSAGAQPELPGLDGAAGR